MSCSVTLTLQVVLLLPRLVLELALRRRVLLRKSGEASRPVAMERLALAAQQAVLRARVLEIAYLLFGQGQQPRLRWVHGGIHEALVSQYVCMCE